MFDRCEFSIGWIGVGVLMEMVDFAQGGMTPLYSAAFYGHEGVVRLLLDSKAAVDTADKVGGMIWVLGWFRYVGLGQTRGRLA